MPCREYQVGFPRLTRPESKSSPFSAPPSKIFDEVSVFATIVPLQDYKISSLILGCCDRPHPNSRLLHVKVRRRPLPSTDIHQAMEQRVLSSWNVRFGEWGFHTPPDLTAQRNTLPTQTRVRLDNWWVAQVWQRQTQIQSLNIVLTIMVTDSVNLSSI